MPTIACETLIEKNSTSTSVCSSTQKFTVGLKQCSRNQKLAAKLHVSHHDTHTMVISITAFIKVEYLRAACVLNNNHVKTFANELVKTPILLVCRLLNIYPY